MGKIRRAVIDVGTNSIKLLVADIDGTVITPVWEASEQTRLGAGFFETSRLQPEAIAKTAHAVNTFAAKARELQAVSMRVIATSAARDALNPLHLTLAIERTAGLKVEIISGDHEADLAFQGVNTDPQYLDQPLLLLDVGGGSTEFILGQGLQKQFRQSFPLGTVRLLEKLPPADPPTALQLAACRKFVNDFLDREVREQLTAALDRLTFPMRAIQFVGTGGTATIMARIQNGLETYQRELIEATRLSFAQIQGHTEQLWKLTLAERKNINGLPKSRADVILPGLVIYETVMKMFTFSELRISTRGLRFAAVMESPLN